jgi:hypothetical protein
VLEHPVHAARVLSMTVSMGHTCCDRTQGSVPYEFSATPTAFMWAGQGGWSSSCYTESDANYPPNRCTERRRCHHAGAAYHVGDPGQAAARPLTDRWREAPIEPGRSTQLGISFRPPQVEALGLDTMATLRTLLRYPFHVIRLGAYWNRIEPEPHRFHPEELDLQVDAAEQAGKQIILCVGALKTFGYPEFFVPAHHLRQPLREGSLVEPSAHPLLIAAAIEFVTRIVERYRGRSAVVAWQVEHEAVDPLGLEYSWRLAAAFVAREVDAVRGADPTRPIVMTGSFPPRCRYARSNGGARRTRATRSSKSPESRTCVADLVTWSPLRLPKS